MPNNLPTSPETTRMLTFCDKVTKLFDERDQMTNSDFQAALAAIYLVYLR